MVSLAANPEPELTPRRGVAVVLYRERHPDLRLQLVLERDPLDRTQVRREDDLVLLGEDQTWHGEAHPTDLGLAADLRDRPGDGLDQRHWRVWRGVADL